MGVPNETNEIFKLQYNSVRPLILRMYMSCAIRISVIWGVCCHGYFRCLFKHILLEVQIRLETGVMNNSCMTCSKSKSNAMHPNRWFSGQWISDKPIHRFWSLSVFLIRQSKLRSTHMTCFLVQHDMLLIVSFLSMHISTMCLHIFCI